ncbi:MAG: molecular chaperone DnaK [Candidatus Sumerlaeia bacterium]|nr:molecular chaperone DnaK [Candidatus Sumerlaeia bacterium]
MAQRRIIGIDLGTTNSVCAVVLGSEPEVIPNSEGDNKTPSFVAFLDNGEVVVGELARRQAATNPLRSISSVKRLIGRSFDEVAESGEIYPFQLVDHENELLIDIDDMGYRPQQISALILKKIKESAESYLGEEVGQAVITVPAYFDDMQRQATIEAANMASLEVVRLINEPTAAAMAYGLGRTTETDEVIAVYDFGGGTFDITILEISGKTFEVLTSTGDTQLGGDDLDHAIIDYIVQQFERDNGVDLTEDPVIIRRLKEVAERAKCELSTATQTRISLPFLVQKEGKHLHLDMKLNRSEFEDLIHDFVNQTIRCCKKALEEANLAKKDIDKVILVGGSTRIPMVQEAVEDFFKQSVYKGVNPDEVVALGAATQAGIFEGSIQEVVLLDVTPHSLGIETEGGKFSAIIEKNSTIPIKAAKTFTTTEANQEFVNIHVLQGESKDSTDNKSLGKFSLTNIPEAPAGVPRIRVTFFINADGVMEITAEEMSSGRAEVMTIIHSQLSEEEADRRSRRRQRARKPATQKPERRKEGRSPLRRPDDSNTSSKSSSGDDLSQGRRLSKSAPETPQPDDTNPSLRKRNVDSSVVKIPPSPQEFSVLGDTNPSERDRGVIPSAPKKHEPTMAPVDYGKTPHLYSQLNTPVARDVEDARQKSKPENLRPYFDEDSKDFMIEKDQSSVPSFNRSIDHTPKPRAVDFSDQGEEFISYTEDSDFDSRVADTHYEKTQQLFSDARNAGLHEEPTARELVLPSFVQESLSLAIAGENSPEALAEYHQALRLLMEETFAKSTQYSVLRARLYFQMMSGQLKETSETLLTLRNHHGKTNTADVLALHSKAADFFGSPAILLRARGLAQELAGDFTLACQDVEHATKMEPHPEDQNILRRLYHARAEKRNDPQSKFKLVKVLLKSNQVDEAIEILQELQDDEQFRDRALKVLGLCYWQKNMHYLAWQKFKSLKIDEDLKDILYRLATDMEGADQLNNAISVLEHLVDHAPNYRDAEARLKKLNYRLKLQKQEYDSHRDIPILSKESRFDIIEEINRGSMGIIFKAKDKTLNEIVALKMLNDYLCSDPSAVERFKSEARAAKRLSHPYIVRIHDLFEIDQKRFISMEYIEGTDLKRMLLEKTTFTMDMVIYYLKQICDAMGYAHKLSIIHRDIKPANIMVTSDNSIKITDFGIAKMLRSDEATKSGTAVIGTPLYMAPEQIIGDGVDARTDIYSLGIMLYEIVSGNPPFYLGNIEYHHIHTMPPDLPPSVPPNISAIVMKMIAKDPKDRFQSVWEILKAITP